MANKTWQDLYAQYLNSGANRNGQWTNNNPNAESGNAGENYDNARYELDGKQYQPFLSGNGQLGGFGVKDGNFTDVYDTNGQFVTREYQDPYASLKGVAAIGLAAAGGYGLTEMGFGAGAGLGGADAATSAAWANGAGLGGDTLGAIGAGSGMGAAEAGGSALVGNGMGAFAPEAAAGSNLVGNGMGAFAPGTEVFTVPGEGGLLGSAGSAISSAASSGGSGLLGGAGKVASLLGGAALGSKPTTASQTQQSRLDPQMQKYLYGDGTDPGLLGNAQNWYNANKTGMNATMDQGLKTQLGVYTDPANMAGYKAMANKGQSLMSSPIAGNPFTSGQASLGSQIPNFTPRNLGFGRK